MKSVDRAIRMALFLFVFLGTVSGCGYTLKATHPHGFKTIYVETFQNDTFEPALEIDLTNGIIERLLFDGTLRITRKEEADVILKGRLTKFVREPLRYTSEKEILEYRLVLMVDLSLWDSQAQALLWEEKNFVGDTRFSTSGPSVKSEEKAREDAITELARRIVDRTVEVWPE